MTAKTMAALIHAIPPITSMSASVYVSEMITFQIYSLTVEVYCFAQFVDIYVHTY